MWPWVFAKSAVRRNLLLHHHFMLAWLQHETNAQIYSCWSEAMSYWNEQSWKFPFEGMIVCKLSVFSHQKQEFDRHRRCRQRRVLLRRTRWMCSNAPALLCADVFWVPLWSIFWEDQLAPLEACDLKLPQKWGGAGGATGRLKQFLFASCYVLNADSLSCITCSSARCFSWDS